MWNVYDSIIFSSLHRHILLLDNKIIVRGCIQRYIFFCGSKCRGRMRWSLLTIIYTPWRKNGIRTHAHTKQEEGKKAQSMNAFVCSFPEFVIKLVSLLLKQKKCADANVCTRCLIACIICEGKREAVMIIKLKADSDAVLNFWCCFFLRVYVRMFGCACVCVCRHQIVIYNMSHSWPKSLLIIWLLLVRLLFFG